METKKNIKVCRTATVAYYVKNHLKSQVEYMRDLGMEVVIVSSYGPEIHQIEFDDKLKYEEIEISRQIDPLKDLVALFKLVRFFKKHKFDIVHSTTPKAGLLSSIAALVAGVPVRLHTWTGQPWVTLVGMKKEVTILADKLIGFLSTKCYADSPSQKEFLIQKRIIAPQKIKVIHKGSISGINLERFIPLQLDETQKNLRKEKLGISPKSKIFTFIGRINKDKGIVELISSFKNILEQGYDCDLLLIGPLDQDSNGVETLSLKEYINDCHKIHYLGYKKKPEYYLSISDIYCMPSYREGFGTTVIEAAAMGVPAVGTRIVGLVDAIEDGITGLLVNAKSVEELVEAFKSLLDNPKEMVQMGQRARKRCVENFDQNMINRLVSMEYLELMKP